MTNSPLSRFASRVLPPLEQYMWGYLDGSDNAHLAQAMRYSLVAGGKRLRPLLVLAVAQAYGAVLEDALPAAAAIEFIHTYSLIHDDLPAMDNAQTRRGQPANHVRFDEATAILAGDALLTDAFDLVGKTAVPADKRCELVQILANAAGSRGMVAGQQLDIDGSAHQLNSAQLDQLNAHKTGALIRGAVAMGAVIGGAPAADRVMLERFAGAFGLGFQLLDDIDDVTMTSQELGKPAHQDDANAKNTYVALLGLEGARTALAEQTALAETALAELSVDTQVLASIAQYLK